MKRIISIVTMVSAALLLLNSCKQEPYINISTTSVTAATQGETRIVIFTTNFPWNATSSEEWIVLHNNDGIGGETNFSLYVAPNSTGKERKGTVTISCEKLTATIEISQLSGQSGSDPSSICTIPEDVPAIIISFDSDKVTVPYVKYGSVTPVVDWGDGRVEDYGEGITHSYSSAGEHTIAIYGEGLNYFLLAGLKGVVSFETVNL